MKKYIYTHVFGYFSNSMCEKKKYVYMYFWAFSKIIGKKKRKKNLVQERIWATAQLYCEKKKLYCNLGFVLHEKGLNGRNYIVT